MASALHSGTGEDPFTKERGLISTMIERLEGETGAGATEKSFCKKELSDTNIKNAEKTAETDKMITQINQMPWCEACIERFDRILCKRGESTHHR